VGLETATYISGLVATNPIGASDPKSQGDNHLRLLKSVLQATFPNVDAAITPTPTELNVLAGTIASIKDFLQTDTVANARTDIGAASLGANTFTARQVWAVGVPIASATNTTVGTDGNLFHITGSTTITDFTVPAGTLFAVVFDDAPLLTHDGTKLVLPGGQNIQAAAGDKAIFYAHAANQVEGLTYTAAAAAPTSPVLQVVTAEDTSRFVVSGLIPVDNTVPGIEEGEEVLTLSITPMDASSTLHIDATSYVANGTVVTQNVSMAIFNEANLCVYATTTSLPIGGFQEILHALFTVPSLSTDTQVYKIRMGGNAEVSYINGAGATQLFGGVERVAMRIMEVV
jgi:hypothetical protein